MGKALAKLRASLSELTARRNTPVPLGLIVQRMNGLLRGWVNYFHYRNCSTALGRLKWHVEERLRTPLRKRHRGKDRATGYRRFSSRLLYRKYRLYRVPTKRVGRQRMPRGEGHRKAVCGKTASTV